MGKIRIRQITIAGLVAAVYAVLSLATQPISFGVYQVRIAEALTVLPFLTAAAIPGLYVGCLLANIIGGMGGLDIVFGPLITLAAAIATRGVYHWSRVKSGHVTAVFPVVVMWVGAIYLLNGFDLSARMSVIGLTLSLAVALGAALVEVWGEKRLTARRLWVVRGLLIVVMSYAVHLTRTATDWRLYLIGGLALMGTAALTMILARMWSSGRNPNILMAPLPPVLFNAFGVSLYLAPLIGMGYWFCVQMIGVGQLIACYLIGVPLLMALRKRKLF